MSQISQQMPPGISSVVLLHLLYITYKITPVIWEFSLFEISYVIRPFIVRLSFSPAIEIEWRSIVTAFTIFNVFVRYKNFSVIPVIMVLHIITGKRFKFEKKKNLDQKWRFLIFHYWHYWSTNDIAWNITLLHFFLWDGPFYIFIFIITDCSKIFYSTHYYCNEILLPTINF